MATTQAQVKLENWLPVFLENYERYRVPRTPGTQEKYQPKIDPNKLAQWLEIIEQPLKDARCGAFLCDPWEIAGLGRNEQRHSSVLAWLLNPQGSHGFGNLALTALLEKLHNHFKGSFPRSSGSPCHVRVESCLDGNIDNRVDIEIDDEGFYLIIEVKIDAQEHSGQLGRYERLAPKLAKRRPWAIVYLTPGAVVPNPVGFNSSNVVAMSWRELSRLISRSLSFRLNESAHQKGAKRQMAEQVVQLFLKRIRSL